MLLVMMMIFLNPPRGIGVSALECGSEGRGFESQRGYVRLFSIVRLLP